MRLNSLMKNPFLVVGLLWWMILIYWMKGNGYFGSEESRLIPTSCKAVLVALDKRVPKGWNPFCEKNNLAVYIKSSVDKTKLNDQVKYRAAMYRELANHIIFIAKNSPEESLERTFILRIRLIGKGLTINAVTEGKDIVKFRTMTEPKFISEHFQKTVQVKETLKK